jgi:iron complex transport system substrate-binding protein
MATAPLRPALAALACALLHACSGRDDAAATAAATRPAAGLPASADAPVTVPVCGSPTVYPRVPQRVVTHDVNITEMFLALGLADHMVGYSGLRSHKRVAPEFQPLLETVPNLSSQGLNLETLQGANADFVFGGWGYGFRDGQITPELLADFGIATYVLTESCIRKVARERVSLEDTFADMLAIGRIFRVEARAQALVDAQRAELQRVTQALAGITDRPKVFVYDSGTDLPTTSGRYGMPNAMIEAAGGRNIFDDLPHNWPKGNWEDVVDRNPDWIVVIDYDQPSPSGKWQFLLDKPELSHLTAIRKRQFVVLEYAEATPGPRNVARVRTLAHAFHPDRVPEP